MTETITYTVDDAIRMLRDAGVDIAAERSNPDAAWADVTDEIENAGGEVGFSYDEFVRALRD